MDRKTSNSHVSSLGTLHRKRTRKMGLIDTAKEALELVDQVKNVELYRRLVDLEREAMEFTEVLKSKDEIISQLEEALALKGNLIWV